MGFRPRTDREGVALALVAVMIVALLAIVSLAIDLGMAYTAHAEAQRVADASALAGASVFYDEPAPPDLEAAADARAREFAAMNFVRNRPVNPARISDGGDVNVDVLVDEDKVRVTVRRAGLGTWFARFIGRDEISVSAVAAAAVQNAGATDCLKPWAVIDLFSTSSTVLQRPEPGTIYDPAQHHYEPYLGNDGVVETGWGAAPDTDWGAELVIKSADPNGDYVPEPGVFLPIRLDPSSNQGECELAGGTNDAGGATYRNNICDCNASTISIGDMIPIEPGNMVGPTRQGVNELISMDPDASWTGDPDHPIDSPLGLGSPRVVHMILIAPDEITSSGMQTVTVTNFGKFFIEGFDQSGQHGNVTGKFFWTVDGQEGAGPTTSPLVKILRLVE